MDLKVSEQEIAKLFDPFVESFVEADDATWHGEISRRKHKIFKRYATRRRLGWLPEQHREEKVIDEEYTKVWQDYDYSGYILGGPLDRVTPWKWHRRCMFASDLGAGALTGVYLAAMIAFERRGVVQLLRLRGEASQE